jgi:hypothetical protein
LGKALKRDDKKDEIRKFFNGKIQVHTGKTIRNEK